VDLWHFETADHRGVLRSVDFLMPFATGEKKWPHSEIGNLSGSDMLGPVRRAERAAGAAKYEEAAEKIMAAGGGGLAREAMLHPATVRK
jgi:hypothetical protein